MPAQLVKFPSQHLILKKNSKYVICNEQSRNALWNWRSYKKKLNFATVFLSHINWAIFRDVFSKHINEHESSERKKHTIEIDSTHS